ncbi:hypothetical protein Glove_9g283 [Diversispora epigaea]|uniref:Uncharacterized protein n=1 Tax=Diversispora epigaea TaxID=1348612 RepID=A0A397JNJ4_9GLOM|nr:hypothetical protein Glove_9g283 [Diversispora epigaea]
MGLQEKWKAEEKEKKKLFVISLIQHGQSYWIKLRLRLRSSRGSIQASIKNQP